ncbi:hypothetical protein [Desulfobaculum bizertense]|uniref:His Kinase A (Phospho-acceptor) domain-containing protein n=1 Tax=Desulfobaculum bizertense DSM 18034 TaxID=1121442 RepID=A0A1T4VXW5_9BACT|nr:hypothetical protein [Desulfobaculum bizertense]UIJ36949.1 hypothetical protein LWC08_09380 [Desulfobaculum bizertense]SKA69749.1 hypothetical protein SAMN02745702_01212 [Desulfobaculum bizertense DSM 18034]
MSDRDWTDELTCFGKVAASVSHEFKNHLATIREKAGLLSDLLAMQARGKDVSLARITQLALDVQKRTVHADEAVKRLNRFAHSVDHLREEVNMTEAVELATGLFFRLATMRGVELKVQPADDVMVLGSPFAIQQMLLACLDACTLTMSEHSVLGIGLLKKDGDAVVRFEGCKTVESAPLVALTQAQHARCDSGPDWFELHIPMA